MRNKSILEELIATLPREPVPVRSVVIGAHWTAVCSRSCGLATTVQSEKPHDHETFVRDAGHLHEKTAQELADMHSRTIRLKPVSASQRSTPFLLLMSGVQSGSMPLKC